MTSSKAWFISLIYDFHEPSVSNSLGHRVPAAVNLSLQHTTSIFLTRTNVYGYKLNHVFFIAERTNFLPDKTDTLPTQTIHNSTS